MIRAQYFTSMDDMSFIDPLREELGMPRDAHDPLCVYAVTMTEDQKPTGFGRLYVDDDSRIRMDDVGVLVPYRGMRFGDLIARMLLFRAQDLGAGSVCLTCPEDVKGFFARYGFRTDREEGGLFHMSIAGSDIDLDTCAGCSAPGGKPR